MSRVVEAYWTDHKPIYFAFKLLDYVPQYHHIGRIFNGTSIFKITTIYGSHIDHIWTNVPTQQCMLGVVETYWIDHKPIYFAFKLLDYVPQCHHIGKKYFFFKQY
jgi:hypothetical protein